MLVYIAFAFKGLLTLSIARHVRSFVPDALSAYLAAWVIVHAALIAVMLGLSAVDGLTQTSMWITLVAATGLACLRRQGRMSVPEPIRQGGIPLVLASAFLVAFAFRAAFFQDFSWDAQTYGLPRIALWMNWQTLYVHMPTPQINVFANEWNGELLGLFYGLIAGNLQGPVFANAEVLIVTYIACAWLARMCGASWPWAFGIAGLIAFCPASLGLATTVKGDLLACTGLVLACGWLLVLRSHASAFAAVMVIGAVALAVGAKITAVFGLMILAAGLSPPFAHLVRLQTILGAGVLAVLFLSRYIINLIVYGNPVQRVASEQPEPGFTTLVGNLKLMWDQSWQYSTHAPGGPQWSFQLQAGLGFTGAALAVAVAVLCVILMRKNLTRLHLTLLATLAIGIFVSTFNLPSRPWSFRYFLPMVMGIGLISLALAQPRRQLLPLTIVAALCSGNIYYLLRPGDVNGNNAFGDALKTMRGEEPIERTFISDQSRRTLSMYDTLSLDRTEPLSIAIVQEIDQGILAFMGSRAQNRIYLAASATELIKVLDEKQPDLAVVTKAQRRRLPRTVLASLQSAGFQLVEENRAYLIARRLESQVVRAPISGP